MNNIVNISLWSGTIILILVVLGFANKKQDELLVKTPLVNIDYETNNRFVSKKDILNEILNPNDSAQKQISSYDALAIETKINNNSAVKEAQVYRTVDGNLVVNVKQRRPIARIFSKDENYYMDEKGFLMPTSRKYAARVPIVSGYIKDAYGKGSLLNYANLKDSLAAETILDDVYKVVKYIDESTFWSAQIEQVYVNKELELELVPKVGNHKIVFGEVEHFENKFNKLMIFYKKALTKTGWNEYSVINLKYKDQVVCKKIYN